MSLNLQSARRQVVVNADDFGMSLDVNRAILQSFDRGIISSATIMANMPGFDDACRLAHEHHLLPRIGLHLNFTSGRPLTANIAQSRRFCDVNGCWLRPRQILSLSKRDALALEAEIVAQVLACKRNGITPTHWDSHHHIHTELGIMPVIIRMAKRLGNARVRLAFNCGPRRKDASLTHRVMARTYQRLVTSRLRFHRLAGTDYFGTPQDTAKILRTTRSTVEVMVHPKLDSRGRLVDLDGEDLESRIAGLCIPLAEMCSYRDL